MSYETDYESLGPLPDGWESVPLKSVVSKLVDGSHNPPAKQDSGRPMLSARNIENNKIVFDDFRYIAETDFSREHARTRVESGDVLLTIVGTIGRSAVVPVGVDTFTLQRSVAVLTPSGVLPKYLVYQLQAPFVQRHFEKHARGTAQKGVYLKTLGQTPIRVAPLDQQKRIVSEIEKQFSRLDEAVTNLRRVKANLKRYKAAVLKAAVEGHLVETEAELAHREAKLGDVVVLMKNGIYKPASEYADDGMPCLRMYNIEAGSIVWRDIKRMKISKEEFAEYGLDEGDLLVNRVNSRELVGKTACIPASLEPSVFESKNIRVRLDTSKVVPQFINYQLLLGGGRYFSSNAQQVVGMASVSQKQLANFPIVLTSLNEQQRIVAEVDRRFSLVREVEAQVDANLKRAQRLRSTILSSAFSGSMEVSARK